MTANSPNLRCEESYDYLKIREEEAAADARSYTAIIVSIVITLLVLSFVGVLAVWWRLRQNNR